MNSIEPVTIVADNLSLGWAQVMERLAASGTTCLSPLLLSIRFDGSGSIDEVGPIRTALDAFLSAQGKRDTENVAWTIFPERYLKIAKGDRAQFYGINVRDSPDAARAFERAFDIPYPSINPDDSARTILAFGGVLTAAAVPSTVVIDADGAVAARVVGQVDASTLIGLVKDASGHYRNATSSFAETVAR